MTVLPEDHLVIKIDYLSGDERSFTIEPHGTRYEKMLKQLKNQSWFLGNLDPFLCAVTSSCS